MRLCGMMSGTSLDGVDAAIIETDGVTFSHTLETAYLPYAKSFQNRLKAVLGTRVLTPEITQLNRELMEYHGEAFFKLKLHPTVEAVGVHGQTIFHTPRTLTKLAKTWQLVDAPYLQSLIKKIIVYDFRSEDIAQGGEGAPLVPVYHYTLFKKYALPLAIVNIGGVANMTLLMGKYIDDISAGDTGPGNALMNDFLHTRAGLFFDEGGQIAASGQVHEHLLSAWMEHPYFSRVFPKSLDRDAFSFVLNNMDALSTQDGMRTLAEFTVQSIAQSVQQKVDTLYACGGGVKNTFLMKRLEEVGKTHPHFFSLRTTESLGHSSDFMEAEAFAFLGGRVLLGLPTSLPKTTGVRRPMCGGRVCVNAQFIRSNPIINDFFG